TSVRLLLRCLPHPRQIALCDVYDRRNWIEVIAERLERDLAYRGRLAVLKSGSGVPDEIYESTALLGATNVPHVLDIQRVRPGTLIVDDSAPHCFDEQAALRRLTEQADILVAEGGMLRSPVPSREL